MLYKLLPYKMYSNSAKVLAAELGIKRINKDGQYSNRGKGLTVINWGSSGHRLALTGNVRIINLFDAVRKASNKLLSFQEFKQEGVSVPTFTTSIEEAQALLANGDVVGRATLTGHSGEGITVYPAGSVLDRANVVDKLWVAYKKKKSEYRVHIFNDELLYVQQKRKRTGHEEVNSKVRNLANGWVFCRENVVYDQKVVDQAKLAIKALGLTFGAVDVIWNQHEQTAYVLEVNTAPGLEGQSIKDYAQAIKKFIA